MSEHREQVTFFDWVRINRGIAPNLQVRKAMKLCYAVPNGFYSKSHKVVNDMKAEGLTKGILDINLDCPITKIKPKQGESFLGCIMTAAGLRIEMKFGKNKLTKEQQEKKELLEEAGFKVEICYSAAEAIRAVFEYLPFKIEDYQGIREFLS